MKYNIKKKRESKVYHEINDSRGHTIYLYDNNDNFVGLVNICEFFGKPRVSIIGCGKDNLNVKVEKSNLRERPSTLSGKCIWKHFSN